MSAIALGGVVIAVLLAIFNLILTAGVVSRLRDHTDRIVSLERVNLPPTLLPDRGVVANFSALTSDGMLEFGSLQGNVLIGAFAQGCPMCRQELPEFVRLARSYAGGREQVVALLVGDADGLRDERAKLDPVARVIHEESPADVAEALGVRGYPAIGIVDADASSVVRAGSSVDDIRFVSAPVS